MISYRTKAGVPLAAVTATMLVLTLAAGAQAATAPVKEVVASHFGAKVNASTGANICTVESGNTCQPGEQSAAAGGFTFPEGVAVDNDPASPQHGDVYVADQGNHRVQELTATGAFVSMFGKEVNATTRADVCTAASHDVCQAGVEGLAAGQLNGPRNIAVDTTSGDVYVSERVFGSSGGVTTFGTRVQKFTAEGRFVLEIGKEVNETTKGNLCTEEEVEKAGVKCIGPKQRTLGGTESSEPGAFALPEALAVGGSEDLLYVGDEHRVQEFEAGGKYKREISLTSISPEPESRVGALALDQATGDVYLTYQIVNHTSGIQYEPLNVVRKFTVAGGEVKDGHFPLTLSPRAPNASLLVSALALDSSKRLAVGAHEIITVKSGTEYTSFGALLDAGTGRLTTEFATPGVAGSLVFSAGDELYAVLAGVSEVVAYKPVPVGELFVSPATCQAGAEHETDATVACSLNGEANAWGVPETEVSFQWGKTPALDLETPKRPVVEAALDQPVAVHAVIEELLPNETYYDRQVGEDENVKAPELLSSETTSFMTLPVAPRIVGEASVPAVGFSSAVLFGELNPENANTTYEFQYGSCAGVEACPGAAEIPGALQTPPVQSPTYGTIGTTVEVTGLQPGTLYHYQLLAKSAGGEAAGGVGSFTTAPAPVVQAATGAASAVAATSAVISGTVNPDGQAAAYTFELGVYNGASTQYGIVFSGPAGRGTGAVAESLALSGLQPGTEYAYRIAAHAGDGSKAGEAATGATLTFTTQGLPAVLISPTPLPMLAVPGIAFPTAVTSKSTTKALTNAQKLAKALTACKKKAKRQRAACQKQARKKYPKSKQANNRKKG